MAILHQQVAHEAELRFLATPLVQQPRLGIGGRAVRGVAAPLAVEVALGIAPAAGRRLSARIGLALEALEAGERLDQRAIDREMFVRQQRLDLRLAAPVRRGAPGQCTVALAQSLSTAVEILHQAFQMFTLPKQRVSHPDLQ